MIYTNHAKLNTGYLRLAMAIFPVLQLRTGPEWLAADQASSAHDLQTSFKKKVIQKTRRAHQ
jgi:hypothetical protein